MFPDADNTPAQFPQLLIDKLITRFVRTEFLSPEGSVLGRHVRMFWTAMPKATIDEHS